MATEQAVRHEIARVVRENPANRRKDDEGTYFEEPLVGFAAAGDPLFQEYKQIIGAFHMTPREVFEDAFGPESLTDGTVVCWVLPVAKDTRTSNRKEDRLPSRLWAHTRDFGEKFNDELRKAVVSYLQGAGARAVAPMLSPKFKVLWESPVGIASTWSERHAVYAAGLGTFSLSDGLITPRGIAHRVGAVVTDLVLPPSPRSNENYRSNCLVFRGKECGVCAKRCPGGAITEDGHDKTKCLHYYRTVLDAVREAYGVEVSGCGLCQTAVPCESQIPKAKET
jgi:epoxyqueuosine reductase QueG